MMEEEGIDEHEAIRRMIRFTKINQRVASKNTVNKYVKRYNIYRKKVDDKK